MKAKKKQLLNNCKFSNLLFLNYKQKLLILNIKLEKINGMLKNFKDMAGTAGKIRREFLQKFRFFFNFNK